MNSRQIEKILRSKIKGNFLGVFPIDRLPRTLPPRRPLLLVCNTDRHDRPGEHWIVLYVGQNGTGEYFDSFGRAPERIFVKFLDRFAPSWCSNGARLQSIISGFCGHYCIFYCLFKTLGHSMKDIVNCFIDDTAANDLMVHSFVCLSL